MLGFMCNVRIGSKRLARGSRVAIAALVLLAAAASATNAAPPAASKGPSAERPALGAAEIERLIADLSSIDYRTREAASHALATAGASVLEAVSKAAQSDDLEVSYRAVRILESMLESNDGAQQDRVNQVL